MTFGTVLTACPKNYFSKIVCSVTGVVNALKERSSSSLLTALSPSGPSAGLPVGCGMATPGTILFVPTVSIIGTIVAICTTGIPATLSISRVIDAPHRVQVPQVDVRIAASTPAFLSSSPISCPNFSAFATAVPVPVVV